MINYTDDEIELERQDAITRLQEGFEEPLDSIRERYQSETGYHEVLHTSHIFMENVEQYLLDHPAVTLDEQAYRFAQQAHTALFNLYQHLGLLRFDTKDDADHGGPPEPKVEHRVKHSLAWTYIDLHLNRSNLEPEMKASIQKTIDFFAEAEAEEDEDDCAVPLSGSFYVMLQFLEAHPELPAPSLGIDPDGLFSVIWQDDKHRWSLRFRPWDIDHSGAPMAKDDPGACKTQKNVLVTEVVRGEDGAMGVESLEYALDDIQVPEWVRCSN